MLGRSLREKIKLEFPSWDDVHSYCSLKLQNQKIRFFICSKR